MIGSTWWAKIEFPKNFQTVGHLAKAAGSLNSKIWERDEVYNKLKTIISVQLSIPEEIIYPNSHFIDELGME